MSTNAFSTIIPTLQIGLVLAVAVFVLLFAWMVFRWNRPNRRGRVLRTLVAVTAIPCMIGLLNWTVGREYVARKEAQRAASYAESSFVHVGDRAPDFTLTNADGAEFSMSGSHGRVVLINFFATWCGPCKKELPHIEKLWNDYRDTDRFRVLVIGRNESMGSVREFRTKNGYSFPIAPDPDGHVFSLFAKDTIPRTVVISPNGEIVHSKAAFYERDVNELRSVLAHQIASLE